jgi:hypothetical protein
VTLACLLAAVGLGLAAAPAAARPGDRLDVAPIIAALDDGERIVRAPGTVARFDEALVRAELGTAVRLVVLPYVDYEAYVDGSGESRYYELVRKPIQEWSLDREIPDVVVTGLDVTMVGGPSTRRHELPADLDELRTTTATRVVTERLVVLARLGRGLPPDAAEDSAGFDHPAPVAAPPERVAEVAAALREERTYNAPGRADPVEDWVAEISREESGTDVRIAAFPVLEAGQPVVDYATPLAAAFPGDVVLVLHGDWLDIAAPDRHEAEAARAFAYGDADLSLLVAGTGANQLLRQTVERLDLLLTETAWGRPQPPPQPRLLPFDVQRTVSTLAPWVLVGSAVVLGGAGVLRHRARTAAEAAAEQRALRAESAAAMAAIGDLGARVLSAEEGGGRADPAAAERHATARLLYDQAHTSVAMAEVRRIAEEGLALVTAPEPARGAAASTGRRRRKAERRTAREGSGQRVSRRKAR